MPRAPLLSCLLPFVAAFASGCASAPSEGEAAEAAATSREASFYDFRFDGEVTAPVGDAPRASITRQLLYTMGQLTARDANAQVGRATLEDVVERVEGEKKHIRYRATLPVAWPKGSTPPQTFEVSLPRDLVALSEFNTKYFGKCGASEYGADALWSGFNPSSSDCRLAREDAIKTVARVSPSANVSTGKYPEYDRVWDDGTLEVVSIFGFAEAGGDSDVGQQQYQAFVRSTRAMLSGGTVTDNPRSPSVVGDVTVTGSVNVRGKTRPVRVTVLLTSALYASGADFDRRYDALSERADLVIYNGHSELAKNTRALANKGTFAAGQYQIFFFNSCNTFTYLDNTLQTRHQAANATADAQGTKYLDVLTNVLQPYFPTYSASSLSLFKALLNADKPKSYNEILAELPSDQVVVVSGEEDNAFRP